VVVVLVPVVNTREDGVVLIVGGGVHVIIVLFAGDAATPVENVVTELVAVALASVRKSLVEFAIPMVAELPE